MPQKSFIDWLVNTYYTNQASLKKLSIYTLVHYVSNYKEIKIACMQSTQQSDQWSLHICKIFFNANIAFLAD